MTTQWPAESAACAVFTTAGVLSDTQSSLKNRCCAAQKVRHTSLPALVSDIAVASSARTRCHNSVDALYVSTCACQHFHSHS